MEFNKNDFKEYLDAIGAKEYVFDNQECTEEKFENILLPLTDDKTLLDKIINNISESKPIYSLKNKNLDISIAISSIFNYKYYFNFMEYVFKNDDALGNKILDIGCDSGILTCYLALKFPNKQIVGVDKCEEGISCANELADKFNLKNIRFICAEIGEINEKFDTVISSRTFNENNTKVFGNRFFLLDYTSQKKLAIDVNTAYSKNISELVDDNGCFISVERIGMNALLLGWMYALNGEHLVPLFETFEYKNSGDHGDDNKFAFMVFKKNDITLPDSDVEDFYSRIIMPQEPNESVPLRDPSMGALKLHKYKNKFIKGYYYSRDGVIYAKTTLWTDKRDDGLLCEQFDVDLDTYMLSVIDGNALENVKKQLEADKNNYKEKGYTAKLFTSINPSISYIMQFENKKKVKKKPKKKKK